MGNINRLCAEENKMELFTLGTSHGATELGRECSANLLRVNDAYYLFDCGGNVEGKITNLGIDFDDIRAVFISHMHEDHIGTLSAIVKRFCIYNRTDNRVIIHMPEQQGIDVFKNWIEALHMNAFSDKVQYKLETEGVIYSDENITVAAIANRHMKNGLFPSYSFAVKTSDKKLLYTGDLHGSFSDYPQIAFQEEFDAILCELVHFDFEKNIDTIIKSKTKKMIFTHASPQKVLQVQSCIDKFPYDVDIAEDCRLYEI